MLSRALLPYTLLPLAAMALIGCQENVLSGGNEVKDPIIDTELPWDFPDTDDTVDEPIDTSLTIYECDFTYPPNIAVPLSTECDAPPVLEGSFTPVIEWELSGYNAYGPPVVGQLDDDNKDGDIDEDDTPDVLFVSNNGKGLVAVDGKSGTVKWTNTAVRDTYGAASLADIDNDGVPEVICSNGPDEVVALDNTGSVIWTTSITPSVATFLFIATADMDRDGDVEVIAGNSILQGKDGKLLGKGAYGGGGIPNNGSKSFVEGAAPAVVDIDGDGDLEVVTGNAAYRIDGSTVWSNGLYDGLPAVADFDNDGEPEIVVSSGNSVIMLESDGTPTGWSDTFSSTNYVGPIAVDDLDGDGFPEFVAVGSNQMRAYRADGTLYWTQSVTDSSGAAGPVMFDFENDGYPEVVYADERKVRIFNGLDGTIKLESSDHGSATAIETPAVADVDNDGNVEIIMLHGNHSTGLTIYGDADQTWPAGRQVWNQHAYHITNINDDLSVPVDQEPNWDRYNNYRSAHFDPLPADWFDVSPEVVWVCLLECPRNIHVMVRVWNQGTQEVPAGIGVVLRAGEGGPIIGSTTTYKPIQGGRSSDSLLISIDPDDLGSNTPWLEVDRNPDTSSNIDECLEENNTMAVDAFCR